MYKFKYENKFKNLKLKYLKKNNNIYNFEIVINNLKNGEMIFLKK